MTIQIEGYFSPGLELVEQEFRKNFEEEGELGASLTIYQKGEKIVDLWGGLADEVTGKKWERDTLCGFYSTGKPLAALGLLRLIDQGMINLETPVADVWSDFASNGKHKITFRQVLCHQAGLSAVKRRLPEGAMFNWDLMVSELAAQSPWWEPGSRHVYHTNTFGYLVGEPVRILTGLMPGQYLQNEITGPLNEEVYFGVPTEKMNQVATLKWEEGGQLPDTSFLDGPMPDEERMLRYAHLNPSGFSSMGVFNTFEWRKAQIPSTNGHGTARGVAHIYSLLACGGSHDSFQLLSADMLEEATSLQSSGFCPSLQREVDFGLGFQLTRPDRPLGPNKGSFGHFGTGGSLGFADPEAGIGFGYVMNRIKPRWQNARNRALVDALYQCL